MPWLPAANVEVVKLATPAVSGLVPSTAPLSLNVTVPVGVPPVPVTVAVKVTGWPTLLGFSEEVSVVCVVVAA